MSLQRSWLIAISVTALVATGAAGAAEQADLILYNGKVLTVDKDFSIRSAIVVKDGKILAVGGNDLATRYSAPRGPDGVQHGFAEEAVSREDAICMYTANGPYLSWEENIKGTLEPGKLADFIVLHQDPLTVPEKQLLTLQIDETYLGGKLEYQRKRASGS